MGATSQSPPANCTEQAPTRQPVTVPLLCTTARAESASNKTTTAPRDKTSWSDIRTEEDVAILSDAVQGVVAHNMPVRVDRSSSLRLELQQQRLLNESERVAAISIAVFPPAAARWLQWNALDCAHTAAVTPQDAIL